MTLEEVIEMLKRSKVNMFAGGGGRARLSGRQDTDLWTDMAVS